MSMTLQFNASDLAVAGVSVQWLMSYHQSGAGKDQEQPWFDPYCIVFDTECNEDLYFNLFNINNNPFCISNTTNPDKLFQIIQFLIRNSIPFQVS